MDADPRAGRKARRSDDTEAKERFGRLTRRERQVMRLVVMGRTSRQISAELGISHRTVDVHRGRIMLKIGATSAIELVHLAHHLSLCEHGRVKPLPWG